MARQLLPRPGPAAALLGLCAAVAGCGHRENPEGLVFEQLEQDLGRFYAGDTLEVRFPFEVHGPEPVVITGLEPDCGCLDPAILVDGEPLPPQAGPGGWLLEPGVRGEVQVMYATAGYKDRKRTGVVVRGVGPGLPLKLRIDSWLDPRFRTDPETLQFGAVDGKEARTIEVTVRGEKPFRITELLGGSEPLVVEGYPSASAALEQTLRVTLPALPAQPAERRAAWLNLGTDVGYSFRLVAAWEWVPEVWLEPWPRMVLLGLDPAATTFADLVIAARTGVLTTPEVTLEDLPGATFELLEERPGSRYRVKLTLPAGMPPGPLKGRLRVTLRHAVEGTETEIVRELPILGVVPETS